MFCVDIDIEYQISADFYEVSCKIVENYIFGNNNYSGRKLQSIEAIVIFIVKINSANGNWLAESFAQYENSKAFT